MPPRLRIATTLLYLVAAIAIAIGALEAFGSSLLPYHQRLLGAPLAGFDGGVAALYFTMRRSIGAGFFAIGVAILVLTRRSLSRGERSGWVGILALVLCFLGPLVGSNLLNGLNTPWWQNLAALLIALLALAIARPALRADHAAA
jgi:hypothetical protein